MFSLMNTSSAAHHECGGIRDDLVAFFQSSSEEFLSIAMVNMTLNPSDLESGSTMCSKESRRRSSTALSVFMVMFLLIALGLLWWAVELRWRRRAEYKVFELNLSEEHELIRSGKLKFL